MPGNRRGKETPETRHGLLTPHTPGCESHSIKKMGGQARAPEWVHTSHSSIHSPNMYWEAGAVLHAGDRVWSKISLVTGLKEDKDARSK